ncbi:unnamed protein product [Chrysoparadoxa australica]
MATDRKGEKDSYERRTWDKEEYESRARRRVEEGDSEDDNEAGEATKEEFEPAEPMAAGPEGSKRAFLKLRKNDLNLEAKIGKTQQISAAALPNAQGGYWCEVCKCLLKDSMAYLDHINGKKHQRALGYSMRVERSSVNQVQDRLRAAKRKAAEQAQQKAQVSRGPSAIAELDGRAEEAEEERRRKRAATKKAKEAQRRAAAAAAAAESEEDGLGDDGDDEMARIMGFGKFASS